jgi:arylsulfatase A-like enzyme
MAASGLRFTQGYANSPVCSPTRFALMPGRYQYRLRGAAEESINSRFRGSDTHGLPPNHPTLPSLLHDAGWRTGLIGKQNPGYPPHFGPLRSGHEEFFARMSRGVDLTEGGIRVPWIAQWPQVVQPAGTTNQHCKTMDWSATMLDAAGVASEPAHPLDGVALMPVLREARSTFARTMAWRLNHRGQRALREGRWK